MKKILLVISLVIVTPILLILAFLVLPWALIFIGILFEPAPAAPDLTYAEFPFRLEYETTGKLITIEDSLICKYDGIGMNEGVGKYHRWKDYLANGNEEIILYQSDENNRIIYSTGCPKEYMEGKEVNYQLNYNPYGATKYEYDGKFTTWSMIEPEELMSKYQIKIINIELDEPIQAKPNRTN